MSLSTPVRGAEAHSLRAGAARVDITPKDLAGLVSVWAKPFEGVHDPIFVRALALDNGVDTAAIVATDLVEFGPSIALRQRIARELAIPADHIIITASHDHNAPRGGPITPGTSSQQGRPLSTPAYTQFIDEQVMTALRQAKASLQPARVGVGTGRTDINVNRNGYSPNGRGAADPEGPSDKTVWVVKFESLAGEPLALLMNYAVHSVVAGMDNALVTGDLAGAAERFVERRYQDKVVALWTMGPAGDQNPKYNVRALENGRDTDPAKNKALAYEAMDAMGQILGAEVIQTASRITRMTPTARIQGAERVFTCATKPPVVRPAGPGPGGPGPGFTPDQHLPSMDVRLGLILINQIAITGVSGEVFTRIYSHLKKNSPLTNTMMVTMANDRIGYIADDASYDRPVNGAPLERGCAENRIVNGLVEMMGELL